MRWMVVTWVLALPLLACTQRAPNIEKTSHASRSEQGWQRLLAGAMRVRCDLARPLQLIEDASAETQFEPPPSDRPIFQTPTTRGNLTWLVSALIPAVLEAHGEPTLAQALRGANLEDALPHLVESLDALSDVVVEAHQPTVGTCSLGSPRATARRVLEATYVEVRASLLGPFSCGTGWPDHLLDWDLRWIVVAAVAAGVSAENVVAMVREALPGFGAGPSSIRLPIEVAEPMESVYTSHPLFGRGDALDSGHPHPEH